MVAIVNSSNSLRHTFHYNENKVKEGVATCIMAGNYPMELPDMQQIHRLNMLLKIGGRNGEKGRNCMHITLNFAPGEVLPEETLRHIAGDYMELIGFGEQPFLVYQHKDAGHPHVHIVTTKIRHDGTGIDTFNIGRNQSRKACIELEGRYGLVKAQQHRSQLFEKRPLKIAPTAYERLKLAAEKRQARVSSGTSAAKISYGRADSKRSIKEVLDAVLNTYNYASIEQLNAVLGLYNVYADRGKEGSMLRKLGGLLYHILDDSGKPIGVPIKASSFFSEPTLKNLQGKFLRSKGRKGYYVSIKNAIDKTILKDSKLTLAQLKAKLKMQGIAMVERRGKDNVLFGITYVDHNQKCVINGSELGPSYAAKGLQGRLISDETPAQQAVPSTHSSMANEYEPMAADAPHLQPGSGMGGGSGTSMLDILMRYDYVSGSVPYPLRPKKKKKKKKE